MLIDNNFNRPPKCSCLHFLLADLVEYLWPHTPPIPLSLCRAEVKKQHRLNH